MSQDQPQERIVSLNGAITEILAELDQTDNIVGVDVTSTYPEKIKDKAQDLGHATKISVESILALQPTTLYATKADLNQQAIEQLSNAGVHVEIVEQNFSLDGTKQMIQDVARSLNNTSYNDILANIDTQAKGITPLSPQPKVLFIYARGAGTLMVAGQNTPLDTMITLAGGQNAVQGFDNYKPLTPESLLNANPDYILMFSTGLKSIGGEQGILQIEGISQTNAGKNNKIIVMDGQFLSGFGPRLGQAILELNQQLAQ
ncbi:heme/hemin ABC transporter substrate-binding protein [Myroides sp. LJL115]